MLLNLPSIRHNWRRYCDSLSLLFGPISTDDQYRCDVFVIMPFKDEFRDVYSHVILKTCTALGLTVKLGDDFFSNRQIINEIWSAINNCRLVIADCTERNPNVFYELGIAHTLEKNTILITKSQEDIPFDIRGVRHIFYTDSIAGANKLAEELQGAIPKLLSTPANLTNSFSVTNSLQNKDPARFKLSLSNDVSILSKETAKALKLDEYEWMELFAEAWLKLAPGETRAYEDLGKALIRSNQPQKAIPIGERLIKLSKINYVGYQILGQAYSLLGEWEDASKWLKIALGFAPQTFKQFVLIEILETYEAMGLVDEAIDTLEKLIPQLDSVQKQFYEEKLIHLKSIGGI